jgi:L-lactate dehydrogenase complex protein LldG
MSDRARVLSRIRDSLRDVPPAEPGGAPETPSTERPDEPPVELFVERVEEYRGAVRRTSAEGIAAIVRELIPAEGRLLLAPGVDAGWLPDDRSAVVDNAFSAVELDGFDGVLTGCRLAIAETGTIVLDGGPLSGRRAISLVPDLHVCVVRIDQIVGSVPDAMARLKEDGRDRSPLTFVSGPSATSDIEFRRVEGVHGPRNLEVILVEGAE